MSWVNSWWHQVSGTAMQGLQITIVGMSLVFFTLGLIILLLALLTRLPGLRAKRTDDEPQAKASGQALSLEPAPDRATHASPASRDAELARIAAITVAMLRTQPLRERSPLRQQPTRPQEKDRTVASKWKQYGRAHQLGL